MTAFNPAATFELPAFELSSQWYRRPSVTTAFVLSLLLHAAALALLPSLRTPQPAPPAPIVVDLVPAPRAPEPVPVPPPQARPAKPTPPPPIKKAEPPPVRELVVPQPRFEPPAQVQQQPPTPPEPAAQPPVRSELPPPPIVQPRVEAAPEKPLEPAAPPPRLEQAPPPPPAAALDSGALKGYASVLSQAIGQKKNYPRIARMRHWQGTSELKLQIGADGKLKEVSVARSSGFAVLDEQAVRMVQESQPLPQAPEALRGRDFAINVPVVFRLQDS